MDDLLILVHIGMKKVITILEQKRIDIYIAQLKMLFDFVLIICNNIKLDLFITGKYWCATETDKNGMQIKG